MHKKIGTIVILVFIFFISGPSFAAGLEGVNLLDLKLKSDLMKREMPYRVLLPADYEKNKNKRFGVIYLLHGLTGHFNDWTERSRLKNHAAEFDFIIVTPEGENGWYTDSATVEAEKYESYIIRELIPEIDRSYRTRAERSGRGVAGLSMGGYGALKFGLKHPEMFALAGSFSGALAITEVTDKNSPAWISNSVMRIFGPAESETRAGNDIFKLIREMPAEKVKALPFLYLDCGTEDFLIKNNRDFLGILQERKIPHEYRELPGIHDWKYWDGQVVEFLELSRKLIKPEPDPSNGFWRETFDDSRPWLAGGLTFVR